MVRHLPSDLAGVIAGAMHHVELIHVPNRNVHEGKLHHQSRDEIRAPPLRSTTHGYWPRPKPALHHQQDDDNQRSRNNLARGRSAGLVRAAGVEGSEHCAGRHVDWALPYPRA